MMEEHAPKGTLSKEIEDTLIYGQELEGHYLGQNSANNRHLDRTGDL